MIALTRGQLDWFYRVLRGRLPRVLEPIWATRADGAFYSLDEVRRGAWWYEAALVLLLGLLGCARDAPVVALPRVEPWTHCDLLSLPACEGNNECEVVFVERGGMVRSACAPR